MTKHSKIAKKDKISSIRPQARAKQQATVTAVGVDVGDQYTELCALDEEGEIVSQTRIRTTQEALQEHFREQRPLLVALETGTHSGWISRVIAACGHDVVVANARELRKIHQSDRKNDRADAEILARMVRYDRRLLAPTRPRSAQIQADTALLRAREAVVQARVRLINAARGLTKAAGGRLPGCTTDAFAKRTRTHIPSELQAALGPLFLVIEAVTEQIRHYDKRVEAMASEQYPKTTLLQQVAGVGPLTALGFMLTLGEEGRFARSRDVGAYLGLVPRQDESGQRSPQLPITKAGNTYLRHLLVESAHYILGPFGPDCDLRRFGLRLSERGGKSGKRRAIVAVARKLAILLHRLWLTGEAYDPMRNTKVEPVLTA